MQHIKQTPVLLLNNLVTKNLATITYDFDDTGLNTLFYCTLKIACDKFVFYVTGAGRTKKEAKHFAACSALILLAHHCMFSLQELIGPDINSKSQSCENPVGYLIELSRKMKWDPPVYTVTIPNNLPTNKTFSVQCVFQNLVAVGTATSKVEARRIAAKNILQDLQETLDLRFENNNTRATMLDNCITLMEHFFGRNNQREKLKYPYEKLRKIMLDKHINYNNLWAESDGNLSMELNRILKILGLEYTITCHEGGGCYFSILEIKQYPDFNQISAGHSKKEAEFLLFQNSLNFFRSNTCIT